MTMYWRCDAIPELGSVLKAQRRRLWSEAVTRSFSVRCLLARLATTVIVAVVFAGVGYLLWPKPVAWLVMGLLGALLAGAIFELKVAQPRARRGLLQHAGELDRYRSA